MSSKIKKYLENRIKDCSVQLGENNSILRSLLSADSYGRLSFIDVECFIGSYKKAVEALTLVRTYNNLYGGNESLTDESKIAAELSDVESTMHGLIRKMFPGVAEDRQQDL